MTKQPAGDDLASVLTRLREAGPFARVILALPTGAAREAGTFRESPDESVSTIRLFDEYGYTLHRYRLDVALLEQYYLATIAEIVSEIARKAEGAATLFRQRYLLPDEEAALDELALAMRDWLPFVSELQYLYLAEQAPPVPAMTEHPLLPKMPDVPPMSEPPTIQGRLGTIPKPGPTPRQEQEGKNTRFVSWRTLKGQVNPLDPRREVLKKSRTGSEETLKRSLYPRHPILLVLPQVEVYTPNDLAGVLQMSERPRKEALREVVEVAASRLTEFANDLVALTSKPKEDMDWDGLEPLLHLAHQRTLGKHVGNRVLEEVMGEIRLNILHSTNAYRMQMAILVATVAIGALALGAAGGIAVALAISDVVLGVADLSISIITALESNSARAKLRSVDLVDPALKIASEPDGIGLGLMLGVVGLTFGVAGVRAAVKELSSIRQAAILAKQRNALPKELPASGTPNASASASSLIKERSAATPEDAAERLKAGDRTVEEWSLSNDRAIDPANRMVPHETTQEKVEAGLAKVWREDPSWLPASFGDLNSRLGYMELDKSARDEAITLLAARIYKRIRNRDPDAEIRNIVEFTGLPEDIVRQARRHQFEAEHNIPIAKGDRRYAPWLEREWVTGGYTGDETYFGHFVPNFDMARDWEIMALNVNVERRNEPGFLEEMRYWIRHEVRESELMAEGLDFQKAHRKASETHPQYPPRDVRH